MKTVLFVASVASAIAASSDAGFRGFAGFSYIASNGNRVIDVFALVSNSNDRLMNVFNANISNNAGVGGATFFTQVASPSTRGWKPDANSSNRSNIVDSFMTIGVDGGMPDNGQYVASGGTGADGSFTNWSSAGANTVPVNAGWFLSPPTLPDNVAESLSGMTGTRVNLGSVANSSNFGIWCAHLVMDGSVTSCIWSATCAIKDGVTQLTNEGSASGQIPAPGAVALLAFAGITARRRRV